MKRGRSLPAIELGVGDAHVVSLGEAIANAVIGEHVAGSILAVEGVIAAVEVAGGPGVATGDRVIASAHHGRVREVGVVRETIPSSWTTRVTDSPDRATGELLRIAIESDAHISVPK